MSLWTFRRCALLVLWLPPCASNPSECKHKNVSCSDITTAEGFRFDYDCALASEVTFYRNQTLIAFAHFQSQTISFLSEVVSVNKTSAVTRDCRDLQLQCITPNGEFVTESCEDFTITENIDAAATMMQKWLIVSSGVLVLVLFAGMVVWRLRRKLARKHGACCRKTCCCHREELPPLSLVLTPLSPPHGDEDDVARASDQDNWTRTGADAEAQSNGQNVDDELLPSLPLDHNPTSGRVPAGNMNGLKDEKSFHHHVHNRNLRDDPGGESALRTRPGGRGDGGPEGRALLPDQRAAVRGAAVTTGEAATLVNKRDFDPEQVSGRSAARDNDVESVESMEVKII